MLLLDKELWFQMNFLSSLANASENDMQFDVVNRCLASTTTSSPLKSVRKDDPKNVRLFDANHVNKISVLGEVEKASIGRVDVSSRLIRSNVWRSIEPT